MDIEDFDLIFRNKKIFCFGYNIFICGIWIKSLVNDVKKIICEFFFCREWDDNRIG